MEQFKGRKIVHVDTVQNGNTILYFDNGEWVLLDSVILMTNSDLNSPKIGSADKAPEKEKEELEEKKEKEEPEEEKEKEELEKEELEKEKEEPEVEKEEPEVENPDDFWTWADIKDEDRDALREIIADDKLDIKVDDYPKIKKLRKAVAKELGIKPEEIE